QPLLNAYPLPNGTDFGNGLAEFDASFADPTDLKTSSIRIDHILANGRLFGRYNYSTSNTTTGGGSGTASNDLFYASSRLHTLTTSYTLTPAQSITNELRLNYSRASGSSRFDVDTLGGAVRPSDSVLFPVTATGETGTLGFFPLFGSTSLIVGNNAENLQRQLNIVDGLQLVRGSHQLKFGFDYRRLSPSAPVSSVSYGQNLISSNIAQFQAGFLSSAQVLALEEVDLVLH